MTTQNSGKSGKRKPPTTGQFKKGQSGNPGGRPKNEKSVSWWLHYFGNMSPAEAAKLCSIYARELRKCGDELPIFALIAVRALMALIDDPDARLFGQIVDRVEGRVVQPFEWQEKVKDAGLDPFAIVEQVRAAIASGTLAESTESESDE